MESAGKQQERVREHVKREHDRIERAIRVQVGGDNFFPFSGVGIDRLLDYLVWQKRLTVTFSGEPTRQTGGLLTGADYCVGIFHDYEQKGFASRRDFCEAVTIAAAQALDILPQVGRPLRLGRKE